MLVSDMIRKTLVDNHNLHEPMVLKSLIDEWPAANWTPASLSTELGQQKLRFRIGQKRHQAVQWETACHYKAATVADFNDWVEEACNHDNPLAEYPRHTHWCYADYMYMAKVFAEKPHMLEAVEWLTFGFEGRDGSDSTWWMGSEGAHTVCHYDTYGCNLVAQLYGRKRWVMFPPKDTPKLYPTRLPYEESSVFSKVNIPRPDFGQHPHFRKATRYEVILEPGDVLFVPRQWWHHVESLGTSISVNTWIELDSDQESRLQEAVTRLLACSLLKDSAGAGDGRKGGVSHGTTPASTAGGPTDTEEPLPNVGTEMCANESVKPKAWLNPTEELTSHAQNVWYIQQVYSTLQLSNEDGKMDGKDINRGDNTPDPEQAEPATSRSQLSQQSCSKWTKLADKLNVTSDVSVIGRKCPIFSEDFDREHVCVLQPVENKFEETAEGNASSNIVAGLVEYDIIDTILQPDVIRLICEKLRAKEM